MEKIRSHEPSPTIDLPDSRTSEGRWTLLAEHLAVSSRACGTSPVHLGKTSITRRNLNASRPWKR